MTTLTTSAGPLNVIKAEITELLEGAWTARVEVDSDDELSGPISLTDGLTTWVGSIKPDRGAQEHGRFIAQLVGGTGGLATVLGVRNYDSPFISDILADLVSDTGEGLSPETDTSVLTAQVERWSRRSGPGGLSLKQITDESSADNWRIRRDGLIWLGAETYPAVPETFDFTEITRDPSQDTITIAPEENQVLPAVGNSFLGRNVVGVVTSIDEGSLRQVISWESGGGSDDRLLGPMKDLVDAFVGRQIDYARMYPSVVNEQNGDGTLDITPDDERVRGDGFKRVKISYGLPGVTAVVPSGGRVNLYFQNGDPKQPRAALWEGSGVTRIDIGDSPEFVALSNKILQVISDLLATGAAVMPAATPGPATFAAVQLIWDTQTGLTGTPIATPPDVAATKLKSE